MAELTDEQIAEEEKFLKGLPRVNLGALLMPGIWGPAHGMWVAILFYPLWVFVDNIIFNAYLNPEPIAIALAVIVGVAMIAFSVAFAIVSQPFAAHRAENRGVSRETYLKRQRIWAIVSFVLAVIAIAWATYYNLEIRTAVK